jgi:DNA-binding CsgD family transcriptional regulator
MNNNDNQNSELRLENVQLKAKIEVLLDIVRGVPRLEETQTLNGQQVVTLADLEATFGTLTLKQNAALLILMEGHGNIDIARIFECADSTAKVHVRGLFRNLGVNTRSRLILKMRPLFEFVDNGTYTTLTGLQREWARNYDKLENGAVTKMIRTKTR